MTDNEIIKALKCWAQLDSCKNCPFIEQSCFDCEAIPIDVAKSIVDLINRQKAEIEKLKDELHQAKIEISKYFDEIEKAEKEVIKEFAERLKEKTDNPSKAMFDVYEFYGETIDNLAKEMTESEEK